MNKVAVKDYSICLRPMHAVVVFLNFLATFFLNKMIVHAKKPTKKNSNVFGCQISKIVKMSAVEVGYKSHP